jgi:hypothetical protein
MLANIQQRFARVWKYYDEFKHRVELVTLAAYWDLKVLEATFITLKSFLAAQRLKLDLPEVTLNECVEWIWQLQTQLLAFVCFLFEFPNRLRPPCRTMPWKIWTSLVVPLGVCWMFHGPHNEPEYPSNWLDAEIVRGRYQLGHK